MPRVSDRIDREPRRADQRPTRMGSRGLVAIAGASLLIASGCGDDRSTGSPAASTTIAVDASTLPVATTSVTTTDAPAETDLAGAALVALDRARAIWADADIASYRLVVAEDRNFWSAGCTWTTVISRGVVIESDVDPSSTSNHCTAIEWTVEQLHQGISYSINSIREFSAAEFGQHTLEITYNDLGVPVAVEYDLANGADEESSMRVTFTPIG